MVRGMCAVVHTRPLVTALWACLCETGVTVGLIIAINVVWKSGQVDHCMRAILGPLGLIIAQGQLGGLCGLIIANVILIIANVILIIAHPDHCIEPAHTFPWHTSNSQVDHGMVRLIIAMQQRLIIALKCGSDNHNRPG